MTSVGVGDIELTDKTRRAERLHQPMAGMCPTVTQQHAHGVFAFMHHLCKVIGKIHDAIVAEMVADGDVGFIKAITMGEIGKVWYIKIVPYLRAIGI